jgi:hypothetical protein
MPRQTDDRVLTYIGPYEHADDWDPRSSTRIENLSSRDPSPVTEFKFSIS